jgi:anti-sigma regulatory factor (Ser/Thr protein kinase)
VTKVALPATAASAATVRRRIAAELAANGVAPALIEDVVLVASELVTNAVQHAETLPGGRLVVAWEIDRQGVVVRVSDGGGAGDHPHVRHPDVRETSGRGLALVEALASRWGVISGESGRTVWASLRS